ncbi:4'-phosphopantetheinyl transferase superfamily protein [Synechococcus sp. A15-60]|uniref:4'-phosphopantetheinyl transferase family protein n=1 Tax=Synechococcus sp. A15-60 TaxID=1050655 RepID=UPI001646DCBB|nr:4'-phosphopantetheinyl transferase superfamily protein [Synechococcus sp. A15-60]QNI47293.1 putative 4'-phosphopantetheinyl transferase family domain protein [Synechococcus sp. A15-60]
MGGRTIGGSVTALWMQESRSEPSDDPSGLTAEEKAWAESLPQRRAIHFRRSRLWMRSCLASLHGCSAREVPLTAPPGVPPFLAPGWGYISLSHCVDACLLAWSLQPVGVDLERADRAFAADALMRRFFTCTERSDLVAFQGERLRREVLDRWLIKESAIKWQRGTLASDLRFWDVSACLGWARHGELAVEIAAELRSQGDWRMAIAVSDKQSLRDCRLCLA